MQENPKEKECVFVIPLILPLVKWVCCYFVHLPRFHEIVIYIYIYIHTVKPLYFGLVSQKSGYYRTIFIVRDSFRTFQTIQKVWEFLRNPCKTGKCPWFPGTLEQPFSE